MNDAEKEWTDAFSNRFAERANSIKQGSMPPLEGPMRVKWIKQRNLDYQDFLMISDCLTFLSEGMLTLTIDLRPQTPVTLPTDGNKITPKMLDSKADLKDLIDGAEMFRLKKETGA
tara:strand:+ start:807 stop:1154 length:348 start_codon:yes stop_codon:yes gene_type:complete